MAYVGATRGKYKQLRGICSDTQSSSKITPYRGGQRDSHQGEAGLVGSGTHRLGDLGLYVRDRASGG
jgi:hypothetical protein